MKYNLYFWSISIIFSLFVFALSGCSIGIRPEPSYTLPTDNDSYYGDTAYGYYYNAGPAPSYKYYYDSNYDPWTMGNYYENYSPPQRVDSSSANLPTSTDSNSTRDENKRSAIRNAEPTIQTQSGAPSNSLSTLRRERIVDRLKEQDTSDTSSSSIIDRKTRRNVRREVTENQQNQLPEENPKTEVKKTSPATQPEPAKPNNSEDDESKQPKKRRRGVTD